MSIKQANSKMVGKLAVVTVAMFAFGYALVPMYKAICEMTGINILALGDRNIPGAQASTPVNTQIDTSRTSRLSLMPIPAGLGTLNPPCGRFRCILANWQR
jgi:cytochrome c oxidase assembly protein Cox11